MPKWTRLALLLGIRQACARAMDPAADGSRPDSLHGAKKKVMLSLRLYEHNGSYRTRDKVSWCLLTAAKVEIWTSFRRNG